MSTEDALLAILEQMRQAQEAAAERQDRMLATLLERIDILQNQQPPHNQQEPPIQQPLPPPNREPKWDGGLRVEIPNFTGSLKLEEFLDWTNTVKEVFELKEVPLDKRVPLITIIFRERAAAWWQNFKYRLYLDNLPPLNEWADLKREMNREFLPLNYRQTIYRQFQTLTQGAQSVDTLDFYKLEARNQLN